MKASMLARIAVACGTVSVCCSTLIYLAERIQQRRTGQSWLIDGWSGTGATIHDPLLGWTSPPSTHWPDYYGPGNDCTFNARGFRSLEEYDDAVPDGRSRLLVLGDSFAAGLGVGDEETFPAQIEKRYPQVQAVNLAKISYGLDQAVLRYEQDANGMEADIVLLAVIDDDLNRARWDRFNGYWPKPRFRVADDGDLELVGTPVPNFGGPISGPFALLQRSALFLIPRRYLAESLREEDDVALARGILDRLRALANDRAQQIALAYLPTLPELRSGELLPLAAILEQYAKRSAMMYIQATTAFEGLDARSIDACFLQVNAHYSPRGNQLVASAISDALGFAETSP